MSYKASLNSSADAFLIATDKLYLDCDRGISDIERIIIAVPSSLSDKTRAYMVPVLYAYWERFFKICFAEYLRALEQAGISMRDCKASIARFRIRKELQGIASALKLSSLSDAVDKTNTDELGKLFQDIGTWLNGPLGFKDPAAWVNTESNVRFRVLEKNCKVAGVDPSAIKSRMTGKLNLFQGLEDLVDTRNEIAHGATFGPIEHTRWSELRTFVGELQNALQLELYQSLLDETKCIEAQPNLITAGQLKAIGENWSD